VSPVPPSSPLVVTVVADAQLWAEAALVAQPAYAPLIHTLATLPPDTVSVSRDWTGRPRLWLPTATSPWPSDLTPGQVAVAVLRRQSVAVTPEADIECLVLRALILKVGAHHPCPFCSFAPHVTTCPVRLLALGRWLSQEESHDYAADRSTVGVRESVAEPPRVRPVR
jgi:hypothetical protein